MDNLELVLNTIRDAVHKKRSQGALPEFLGVPGMLALMYNDIVNFNMNGNKADDLLALCVHAVAAFATTMPDDDIDFFDDNVIIGTVKEVHGKGTGDVTAMLAPYQEEPQDEEEDDANDPRWTKVLPGQPAPSTVEEPNEPD